MKYAYDFQLNNKFPVRPQVMFIQWIINKPAEPEIKKSFDSVVSSEREDNPIQDQEEKLPAELSQSVSYEIKNITPKKHLWRK